MVAYDIVGDESPADGHSRKNETEATLVAREVQTFLDHDLVPHEIGVITPYRGQIATIQSALHRTLDDPSGIKVDTIDSFQGGDREAIVVSFVRSNSEGSTGFLTLPAEGPRRLNVALTRARKRLTLVADWETLCAPEPGETCVNTYRNLRQWLESEGLLQPLESPRVPSR